MLKAAKKRKLPIILIAIVLIIAIVAVVLIRGKTTTAAAGTSTLSYTAQTSSISTTVSGTGNLSYGSATDIDIPSGLTATEVLVESGDMVEQGDVLAIFDAASIQSKIAEVQANIEDLDDEIEDVKDDTESTTVYSNVSGRVKAIYVASGDSVSSSVLENGALMLISIDGLMSVTLENASLTVGDSVTVEASSGTTYTGTVKSVTGTSTKITLTDNGPVLGDTVTVYDGDDTKIGTGTLAINQPIAVMATSGTVSTVHVSLNGSITTSTKLLTLTDTAVSSEYLTLLVEREEQADMLKTLLEIAQTNSLVAESSGVIESVGISAGSSSSSSSSNDADVSGIASTGGSLSVTLLASAVTGQSTTLTELTGFKLTAPVTGATPETKIAGENGYSGAVEWSPAATSFAAETAYTATITLKADTDYSFDATLPTKLLDTDNTPSFLTKGASIGKAEFDTDGNLVFTIVFAATAAETTSTTPSTNTNTNTSTNSVISSGSSGSTSATSASATASDSTSSDSTSTEVTAFTISDTEYMSMSVSVDELDILSLEVGMSAQITLDSVDDETFSGTITKVNYSASSSGGVTKYTVDISIPKTDSMLSGMSASAIITIEEATGILIVPVDAIQEIGGSVFVYTGLDSDETTLINPVEVQTGLSDGNYVEITSGLSEGDIVYYSVTISTDSAVAAQNSFSFGMGGSTEITQGSGEVVFAGGGEMPSGGGEMPSGGGSMPSN